MTPSKGVLGMRTAESEAAKSSFKGFNELKPYGAKSN